jgi:hypothetical protein
MTRLRLSFLAIAAWLATATVASAQPMPNITPNPTFSPYLNLLRGGSSPAINYFGIVRPEQRFMQSQIALSSQIRQTNQAINDASQAVKGEDPNKPPTGHAATFNNTMGYFGGGVGGRSGSANLQRPQVFGGNRPSVFGGGGGGYGGGIGGFRR